MIKMTEFYYKSEIVSFALMSRNNGVNLDTYLSLKSACYYLTVAYYTKLATLAY